MSRRRITKRWNLYLVGLAFTLGGSVIAMPLETQVRDRDFLLSSPHTLSARVERLQLKVDRMSAQCERFEFAFCKEITDLKVDLREIRGEAAETPSKEIEKIRDLESRIQFVDYRLGNFEGVLLAE